MSVENGDRSKRYFEDILEETGWGLYYKFIVAYISLNVLMNSIATISIYFAVPFSLCNSLLTKEEVRIINIVFIFGQAIGGFFLSCLSDNIGKKTVIGKTLIIMFISCFTLAFSYNSYTMCLAAFSLGSSLQGNSITTRIYLCEILPRKKRGFYMVLPELFSYFGYFIILSFSYFVINNDFIQYDGIDIRLTTWRGLFATVGGLCLVLACISALLESSPRYLLFKKRITSTLLILKQFYAINESKYSENCDLRSQQLHGLINDYGLINNVPPNSICGYVVKSIKIMFNMISFTFSKKNRKFTFCLSLINIALLFKTLNFVMLLAKMFYHEQNQSEIDLLEMLHINPMNGKNCTQFNQIQVYENFFLLSIHILFGLVLLMFVIDSIGRKLSIYFGLLTCAICSLILAYTTNFITQMISSSIFIFSHIIVDVTVFLINIELFPTAIRGTSNGLIPSLAFMLTIFLYAFSKIPQTLFFTISGIGFIGASIVACFLPELKNQPMIE